MRSRLQRWGRKAWTTAKRKWWIWLFLVPIHYLGKVVTDIANAFVDAHRAGILSAIASGALWLFSSPLVLLAVLSVLWILGLLTHAYITTFDGPRTARRLGQDSGYVRHDGVRWKVNEGQDVIEGPFCADDDSPLGFESFGGSRRAIPADDENSIGGEAQLFCPSCSRRYDLGGSKEARRFLWDSRVEVAERFLPPTESPTRGHSGLTITVSNQRKNVTGAWLPEELRREHGTWAPTYIAVTVDARFDPLVPMLLSKIRLLINGRLLIRPTSTSAPSLPRQIRDPQTYSLIFRFSSGKVPGGGTIQGAIWAIADGKHWLSDSWPIQLSVNTTVS